MTNLNISRPNGVTYTAKEFFKLCSSNQSSSNKPIPTQSSNNTPTKPKSPQPNTQQETDHPRSTQQSANKAHAQSKSPQPNTQQETDHRRSTKESPKKPPAHPKQPQPDSTQNTKQPKSTQFKSRQQRTHRQKNRPQKNVQQSSTPDSPPGVDSTLPATPRVRDTPVVCRQETAPPYSPRTPTITTKSNENIQSASTTATSSPTDTTHQNRTWQKRMTTFPTNMEAPLPPAETVESRTAPPVSRLRQIAIGKTSESYKLYRQAVPLELRNPETDPITPRTDKVSNDTFQMDVSRWRQRLHKYGERHEKLAATLSGMLDDVPRA